MGSPARWQRKFSDPGGAFAAVLAILGLDWSPGFVVGKTFGLLLAYID
ncbi:MAG: hypothetical protein U1D30_05365 [Planctomycetota bacterium]